MVKKEKKSYDILLAFYLNEDNNKSLEIILRPTFCDETF